MTTSYFGQIPPPPAPQPRNGLVTAAQNHKKRRNSDEEVLPNYASAYIPTLPSTAFPPPTASAAYRPSLHPRDDFQQQQQQQPIWEPYWTRAKIEAWRHMRAAEDGVRRFRVRDLLSLRLVVMLVWVYVLWWGEESVFNSHIQACGWGGWEDWVCWFFSVYFFFYP